MLAVLFLQAAYSGSRSMSGLLPSIVEAYSLLTIPTVLRILNCEFRHYSQLRIRTSEGSLIILSDGFLYMHALISVEVRGETGHSSDVCIFILYSSEFSVPLLVILGICLLKFSVCLLNSALSFSPTLL